MSDRPISQMMDQSNERAEEMRKRRAAGRTIYHGLKPIGVLFSGPVGLEAAAFPGASNAEVEMVLDAVEPEFAQIVAARRRCRFVRTDTNLRVVRR